MTSAPMLREEGCRSKDSATRVGDLAYQNYRERVPASPLAPKLECRSIRSRERPSATRLGESGYR